MSLRQVCQEAGFFRTPDIRWVELPQAVRNIERRWADRPVRVPPTFQLDSVKGRLVEVWQSSNSLESVNSSDARWLPHVLFHPEAERRSWLARDVGFLSAALALIRRRPRSVKTLLHNVLRVWPAELQGAADIQTVLVTELQASGSMRLREWRRRVDAFKLLSAEGPPHLAAMLRNQPARHTDILSDAGLQGELATSEFVAAAQRQVIGAIRNELGSQEYGGLESALHVFAPAGNLAFRQHAPDIADALLIPFRERNPPPAIQEKIQAFLLTHLKDPRLTQTGWTSVTTRARDLMLRWLVSATLEDFFRLISRWAQEQHWQYRKAFWSAYLKKGHIAHAWVVLGDNARQEALRKWRDAVPAHGRLLTGGDPNHCVLLLRIGSLTIAEWSHNGTCRVWSEHDDDCPRLYLPGYFREELRRNPKYEQRHHGNTSYTWQAQLADLIRRETRIAVMQVNYRVR